MNMMEKLAKALAITAAVLMAVASPALAEKKHGEIIAVAGETYTVKGSDGKEYKVEKDLATGEDLQTGDVVVMEMKDIKPVGVKELQLADSVPAELVETEGGVYTVKTKDGKEIQIKQELVEHFNPRTGEVVEVYMEEGEPVYVKNSKK
jgi:hypothetical protein